MTQVVEKGICGPAPRVKHARYLAASERFEKRPGSSEPRGLSRLRKNAMARFAELGFPATRDEEWKFTSVAPIAERSSLNVGAPGAVRGSR